MKIKLSNSPSDVIQQPTQPRNTGVARLAHERLQWIISAANRQHENALRVDGATAHYWHRNINRGYPCTCCGPIINKHNSIVQTGGFTSQTPQSVETNSFVLRDTSTPLTPSEVLDKKVNTSTWNEQEQGFDIAFDPEELAAQVLGDNEALPQSTTRCAICHGYGRVGALQLFNGERIVLDLSDTNPITLSGVSIDTTTRPYQANGKGYIEWTVTLPQYFMDVVSVKAFNNVGRGPSKLTLIKGSVENDLNAYNIKASQGQNMSGIKIRAYLDNEPFTHIEIQYQLSEWPVIGVPLWSAQTDMRFEQAIVTQSFEFGASIPEIYREDLFWESKNNLLWKIISIDEEKRTSGGQNFGWSVTARVVHTNELAHTLALLETDRDRLPFTGIDYKQGDLGPERISYTHFKTESKN